MRVLVVEDDRALGLFLQKGLELEGHDVQWVGDGESALAAAAEAQVDLVVLDLSLPRRDGTEVLAELSARFPRMSVLVLTGRSQVDERIQCLNGGADDCLLKPFSFHELAARCRAILRRRAQTADPVLRWAGLEMNRLERTLAWDGVAIELTAKEFALMEFLMLRRGQAAGRGELLREVWQMAEDSPTNVVDVYINYLRRKLGAAQPERTAEGSVIETVRGVGYRLADEMGSAKRPVAASAAGAVLMQRGA